jgi:hypothetical protein
MSESAPPADGRFPIEVDAEDLTAPVFSIPGVETDADADRSHDYRLKPGRYGLTTGGSTASTWFTVTPAGDVDYEPGISYLSGRGTNRLKITGLAVTVDARELAVTTFSVKGVTSGAPTATRLPIRVLPADYPLGAGGRWSSVSFSVTPAGRIAHHHPAYLDGAGTTILTVRSPVLPDLE